MCWCLFDMERWAMPRTMTTQVLVRGPDDVRERLRAAFWESAWR